ncbi:methyltransferase domain-containing protein [Streptomyces gardneri]|uniref:class I SAM-dependent methyltransferase n=1 Tax=Streptomyces gardneri TaxID=66892 RepID=UPI0006BD4957|nr:class I SAM-dependent methyltransferase [Streptomyces gardneri]QPK44051.1 methyltransferase domain-containing protein [Streptomyces gardneri]WRK35322.1 class I SAM-dependent methyltransferase [Streptomyces venezuelae]CUM43082.1 hypothetical protein BN2537_15129 [Streptomyces venezuelae]
MSNTSSQRRGRYGVDGPAWLLAFGAGVVAPLAAVAAGGPRRLLRIPPVLAVAGGLFLHASVRGKFLVWEEQLDALDLKGDERVLDLGCGRGAVLTAVARRVPKGRVTGVDIWRSVDQSGNNERSAVANAERERVEDRIDLVTADMRRLPLGDGLFDVVLSSMAIHNITSARGREEAVREAYRVLRPGGRLLIADIFHARRYLRILRAAGAVATTCTDAGPRMWWSGPWVPTLLVSAEKPAAGPGDDDRDGNEQS